MLAISCLLNNQSIVRARFLEKTYFVYIVNILIIYIFEILS